MHFRAGRVLCAASVELYQRSVLKELLYVWSTDHYRGLRAYHAANSEMNDDAPPTGRALLPFGCRFMRSDRLSFFFCFALLLA